MRLNVTFCYTVHQHFGQQHLLSMGFGEMLVQVSAQAAEFFDAGTMPNCSAQDDKPKQGLPLALWKSEALYCCAIGIASTKTSRTPSAQP
jgi:hypothetical protein